MANEQGDRVGPMAASGPGPAGTVVRDDPHLTRYAGRGAGDRVEPGHRRPARRPAPGARPGPLSGSPYQPGPRREPPVLPAGGGALALGRPGRLGRRPMAGLGRPPPAPPGDLLAGR